jgi:hypothetical protein
LLVSLSLLEFLLSDLSICACMHAECRLTYGDNWTNTDR